MAGVSGANSVRFSVVLGALSVSEDVVETLIGMEIVDEADNDIDMRKGCRDKWGSRMQNLGIDVLELSAPKASMEE